MIPVVFGGCRGWLETPAEGVPTREGIVIFGAHGVEELSTRQSLARLAARLAKHGHPVLRFDLPGTGDSLGDWRDPDLWVTWIAAGHSAIDTLKEWSGESDVSLIGLRLGASLAALVAKSRHDAGSPVVGLALLAPVVQGKQYIRELRALANGKPHVTVAGFPLSDETQKSIAAVDFKNMEVAPARRIFMGIPGSSRAMSDLQSRWESLAELTCVPYPALAAHIGDPTASEAPIGLFEQLVEWFAPSEDFPQDGSSPMIHHSAYERLTSLPDGAALQKGGFTERGVMIPVRAGLAGVWCLPANGAVSGPVIVFCNTGRNPHIGWARGTVKMARRLADEGFTTLRFDPPGMGDSPPLPHPPKEMLYDAASLAVLCEVLDHVNEVWGGQRMICLVGGCSGGYLAFRAAVSDNRVAGVVLVNVLCFVWKQGTSLTDVMNLQGSSRVTYQKRVLQLQTWSRLIRGQVDVSYLARLACGRTMKLARSMLLQLRASLARVFDTSGACLTEKEFVRQGFATISKRGAKTVVLYGVEDVGLDLFASYFGANGKRFNQLPQSRLSVLQDFDHDVTGEAAQQHVLDAVLSICR